MMANISRVYECEDVDELEMWLRDGRQAARSFAELAERFRLAPSLSRTPSVLKHDVNTVFPVQAGELLCQCWRRGMFLVYRPKFHLPEEGESRLRYVFSWFTFIRWELAPSFRSRFRADWESEFAPEMDQLKGCEVSQQDSDRPKCEDANELIVWRLDVHADVQATACAILAEELERLVGAVKQRVEQLPVDLGGDPPFKNDPDSFPDADQYKDGGKWCTGAFATERYDLKRSQLTKAWKNPKGIFGVKIEPPKKVKPEKGRAFEVFRRIDLKDLADAMDRRSDDRELSE